MPPSSNSNNELRVHQIDGPQITLQGVCATAFLEARYRGLVECLDHAYVETDESGKITLVNEKAAKLHRRAKEELLDRNYKSLLTEWNATPLCDAFTEASRTGGFAEGVLCDLTFKDGSVRSVESSLYPIHCGEARPVGVRVISRDLTRQTGASEIASERADVRESLHQSEERYRTILEQMGDAYWETDLVGNFTFVNEQMVRAHRRSREELLSLRGSDRGYMDEETELTIKNAFKQVYQTGKPIGGLTYAMIRGDGTKRFVETSISLVKDSQGQPVQFRGVSQDVTERREAEEALSRSEERYRNIVEEMVDGYWEMDRTGRFTFVNDRMVELHRRSREELTGLSTKVFHSEENQKRLYKLYKRMWETGEPLRGVVIEQIRGDGTRYVVETNASLLRNSKGQPIGFRGTTRDVTDRVKAQEELQQAREAAEAASRAKSEFLANMSHEIRTPMNGVMGMTQLALDTSLTAEQRDYLSMVKSSADSLLTIINDILDFSKIEAGKLELDPGDFILRDLVDDTIGILALAAHQKGLELSCNVAVGTPDHLIGDSGRLRQILVNLLGNAVKFTSEGKVALRVEVDESHSKSQLLHFSVTDTGIGIPAEKQQLIFDAFSQADGSTTRRFGGTGLGLSISMKLVKMMDGRLWVESQPGVGSTFHFTARFGLTKETHADGECQTTLPTAERVEENESAIHILLAEDNAINQRLVRTLLEKEGHSVVVVDNGRQAIEVWERERFDLILMDVQMPLMNGYEATELIRSKEKPGARRIPIIALTAHALKGAREKCLEMGMDGYVSKPVQVKKLLEAIKKITQEDHHRAEDRTRERENDANEPLNREQALKNVNGDEKLLAELAEMFLEDYPQVEKDFQTAIERRDCAAIAEIAHSLKGSVGNFGAMSAYDASLKLEMMGREGKLDALARAFNELSFEIERLVPELKRLAKD